MAPAEPAELAPALEGAIARAEVREGLSAQEFREVDRDVALEAVRDLAGVPPEDIGILLDELAGLIGYELAQRP